MPNKSKKALPASWCRLLGLWDWACSSGWTDIQRKPLEGRERGIRLQKGKLSLLRQKSCWVWMRVRVSQSFTAMDQWINNSCWDKEDVGKTGLKVCFPVLSLCHCSLPLPCPSVYTLFQSLKFKDLMTLKSLWPDCMMWLCHAIKNCWKWESGVFPLTLN